MKNVKVYDNGGRTIDRYIVIIGDDVYGMSDDANSSQGFNQYIGTFGRDFLLDKKDKLIAELPINLILGIANRLRD